MMYIKLAWRNLWRNHRRTLITVTSVMFAVVLSLFLESMSRGSYNHMIDITARFHTGYIQIQDPLFDDEPSLDNAFHFDDTFREEILDTHQSVNYVLPRIESFMLAAGDEQTRGALVMGIDLAMEQRLNALEDRLEEGRFFDPGEETAVLGEGLASRLQVAVGDTLVLLGQGRFGMTAAGLYPISGLVSHPLSEMENQIVYLSLPQAQFLLSADEHVTAALVTPSTVGETEPVADSLRSITGGKLSVLTWPELMPEILEGIKFDQIQMYLMMGILYVVIGFGFFGTILTMTLERMKEFGLLLSVGMQRLQLSSIIFIETLAISSLGVFAGSVLGFPILLYLYHNPIEMSGEYAVVMQEMGFEPILPFHLHIDIFLFQAMIIFVLSLLICLYPVIRVLTLNILDASRN